MSEQQKEYYAVKVMHVAESIEVAERIEWCKENSLEFFPITIKGTFTAGRYYTEEEMKEAGEIEIGNGAFINLATLPAINIGIGFVFHNDIDACAFKLQWT